MTVELRIPASKSVTHRALLLGALSRRACRVRHPLWGADNRATLGALVAMGARAERDGDDVLFEPVPDLRVPSGPLDCANSGTTLRLLLAQAARLDGDVVLTGDESLRSRPNGPLLAALAALGADVSSAEGRAPVRVRGPLRAGVVDLPPRTSSQYASGLMLALALVDGDSVIRMAAPVASGPYLELTRDQMARAGLRVDFVRSQDGLRIAVPGGQRPGVSELAVEGDWSTAAFPLLAAAATKRAVRLHGLLPDSVQGDRAVVDLVARFGPRLTFEGDVLALEPAPLRPAGELRLGATPDLFPALCALAALAPGETRLVDAPSLRDKETDRIAAMVTALRALGVDAEELPDGAVVRGGTPLQAASVRSHEDHRVHMALACLGLLGPVDVDGRGCEAVSYPGFHEDLERFRP
ncbi:MAG: 3-phosphoshikimate 1-carboxyvinyltransferase [Alphaproteobacteria bacterium]|nr:3-phosphoshikimate 1-carboxyvinyltransferase [Alphaproteobacteria bacterium]